MPPKRKRISKVVSQPEADEDDVQEFERLIADLKEKTLVKKQQCEAQIMAAHKQSIDALISSMKQEEERILSQMNAQHESKMTLAHALMAEKHKLEAEVEELLEALQTDMQEAEATERSVKQTLLRMMNP